MTEPAATLLEDIALAAAVAFAVGVLTATAVYPLVVWWSQRSGRGGRSGVHPAVPPPAVKRRPR